MQPEKIKEIIEDLVVDMKPVPTGTPGGGTNDAEMKHQEDLFKAQEKGVEAKASAEKKELKESVIKQIGRAHV